MVFFIVIPLDIRVYCMSLLFSSITSYINIKYIYIYIYIYSFKGDNFSILLAISGMWCFLLELL